MNRLPPELLHSFVAVAQTASFSRAAERVHLSQSTVSQQIRRLEDLIGKSLFERDTRTVSLTRDGDALQSYAVRILDLMSEAVEHLRAPALSGHVRLGLSEDFASAGLTAALASFVRRNPEVELTIAVGMSGDLFRELDDGRHDLVFAKRLQGSRRGKVVRTEPLIWCVGSRASGLENYDVMPLALHPEPSVTRLRVLQALEAVGRPYRIVMSSGSVAALKAAVMAGLGVSAFARYVMPDGLVRASGSLPDLGALEFVVDTPKVISKSVAALKATLVVSAREL
ncbi:MAG: transcriptional regulator, LysR family [Gammaproteobacteria bacterium]|nr:transcriptional regulator, LysR family [Gammaproteobacteria bacterium]